MWPRRDGRRNAVRAAVLGLAVLTAAVWGQTAVDRSVNLGVQQTGRLLDVNPQVGGSGQNYYRPMSPLMVGNLSAAGLAGRGQSLRSYSPILDPTAFRGSLGSASLYGFRRDSVGVLSSSLGTGSLAQPYFDPSTTVPTAGLLQGLSGFAPGRGGAGAKPLDLRLSTRMDLGGGGMPPPEPGFLSPQGAPGPVPQPWVEAASRATMSSIFGPGAPPRLPLASERPPWGRTTPEMGAPGDATVGGERINERIGGLPGGMAQPFGGLLRNDLYPHVGPVSPSGAAVTTVQPGLILPEREPVRPKATTPRILDASVMPGYDVFTDMQLALTLLSDPNASWYREMSTAVREQPELAQQVNKQALENSQAFVQKMLHTPLKTLTGPGPSAVNDQLLKAESLMDIGHYAEAADRYEAAHQMTPTNPLPLIGKGHALLAAGNYRSEALAALEGLTIADRTPGLAGVLFRRLDLTSLMGGGEIVDIRRADIMQQLEQRETPELRFLLGYLEYHAGDREHGLENLKRAAENPRAGELIARYPALLEGELPEAPPAEPTYLQPEELEPTGPLLPEPRLQPTSGPAAGLLKEELVLPPRE
jgi:hypothetical protein